MSRTHGSRVKLKLLTYCAGTSTSRIDTRFGFSDDCDKYTNVTVAGSNTSCGLFFFNFVFTLCGPHCTCSNPIQGSSQIWIRCLLFFSVSPHLVAFLVIGYETLPPSLLPCHIWPQCVISYGTPLTRVHRNKDNNEE